MPRKRRSSSPSDSFDEDFDEETSSTSSRSGQPPIQRNAANARERARMRVLSSAFCRLKTKLPNIPADTKLSKLDTLRLATIYIQQLKSLVDGEQLDDTMTTCSHQQQNLTWPFTFQQISNNYRQPNPSINYNNDWNHHQKLPDIYIHNNNQHQHHHQMMHSSMYDNGGQHIH